MGSAWSRVPSKTPGPQPTLARHPDKHESEAYRPWLFSSYERTKAFSWTVASFSIAFASVVLTGVGTLISVPTADAHFADLRTRLDDAASTTRCLRVARRADYAIAFVNLGVPVQHLKLLLRLDVAVNDDDETTPAMWLFSERMHKSSTMQCAVFDDPKPYTERCNDTVLFFQGTDDQIRGRTSFAYRNRIMAQSEHDRAEMLHLDGWLALVRDRTYWLTSTHLCWDLRDVDNNHGIEQSVATMPFEYGATSLGEAKVHPLDLVGYDPLQNTPATRVLTYNDCGVAIPEIELFPVAAAEETDSWLALTTTFLYEYGYSILETRREVVEVGPDCAAVIPDLKRANDVYLLDCSVHYPSVCSQAPSVPFRRMATSKLRIDVDALGAATLFTEETRALSAIPRMLSYTDGLWQALGRLLVMVLTAAVVFVRGNQNASSNRFLLDKAIATVRCRPHGPSEYKLEHTKMEVLIDSIITLTALGSRIAVLAVNWVDFISDGVSHTLVFEVIGIVASALHSALRVGGLKLDLARESPLTKLAGPMSIADASSAVLLVFSDPPLLSTHDGRFAAVGRLLIAILISISVFSRCIFAVTICALVASCVRNSEHTPKNLAKGLKNDMVGYQRVLVIAALLWLLQGIACSATLCILFVQPAAYAMVRMQMGDIAPIRFCIFLGLVAAALPTVTKVALRVLEAECGAERTPKKPKEK